MAQVAPEKPMGHMHRNGGVPTAASGLSKHVPPLRHGAAVLQKEQLLFKHRLARELSRAAAGGTVCATKRRV